MVFKSIGGKLKNLYLLKILIINIDFYILYGYKYKKERYILELFRYIC